MKATRKPQTVEFFRYGVDPRPKWFIAKVGKGEIYERYRMNGKSPEVTGCLIASGIGGYPVALEATLGDYIVVEETGRITPYSPEEFRNTFDIVDADRTSNT